MSLRSDGQVPSQARRALAGYFTSSLPHVTHIDTTGGISSANRVIAVTTAQLQRNSRAYP